MNKKVIIIGAGPAGLSCAYKLAEAGCQVEVFEASPHVGGLARSFDLWGQRVDCGPHRFFSQDKIVNDFFKEVVGNDYTMIDRLTRIYYNNKYFFYPLKPLNAFANLGPFTVLQVLVSYFFQRLTPIKDPKTFEEWIVNRFGKKLFGIFFKNYTEKLWGIPCSKIDADWAAQRIKKLSLWEAVKNAFFGDKGKKHKTLVDQFAYPKGGTGMIYEKMKNFVKSKGGKVHQNAAVKKILKNENGNVNGIELSNGEKVFSEFVVSTMPLTLMVKGLDNVPKEVIAACDKLYYRNTILVYLEIDSTTLFPDNWIYVHDPKVQHGRITNFRNWGISLYGDKKTTILCLEYWCFEKDEVWTIDDKHLSELAKTEVKKIKLVPQDAVILNSFVMRLSRCYPVYEIGYEKHLEIIQEYVNSIPNILAIGRYGAFKYNNQDHSILMGLLAAREIITGKKQNLWDINTDTEYQETQEVLETGLDR
ncbi:MAG: FAD-dependent oxidoreductase [Bacteroidetes bacterium]|nr:FAD-dependent oxidoreductase [Bacteroidota bacterium]